MQLQLLEAQSNNFVARKLNLKKITELRNIFALFSKLDCLWIISGCKIEFGNEFAIEYF